ncbi:MAG: hypothetical protein ACR2IJ_10425 [Fluviibacter sp.]
MAQIKLTSLISKIENSLDEVKNQFLVNMAKDIVNTSIPTIDTGAYITSHSIRTTRGAGRSRSSHNKPKLQDLSAKAAKATEALGQLVEDISSLSEDQTQVFLTNNSPHANIVEYVHGYAVYESVRNRANIHLQDAINTVKARQ